MVFAADPFQRLTAGATFNRAFAILAERYDLFLLIAGLVWIPLAIMTVSLMNFAGSSMATAMSLVGADQMTLDENMNRTEANDFSMSGGMMYGNGFSNSSFDFNFDLEDNDLGISFARNLASFGAQIAIEYILFTVIAIAGQAAMAYAVAEMYAARDPTWYSCLQKGFSRWCDLFGAAFLVGVGVGVGHIIFELILILAIAAGNAAVTVLGALIFLGWFIFMVYVMVSLMILSPVIMVEGNGPIRSIKRCWEVSWNNRCYIFCTMFCLVMTLYFTTFILTIVLLFVGNGDVVFSSGGVIVCTLPLFVYLPMAVILETVVYLNIRVQNEGMNLEVLVANLYGVPETRQDAQYALIGKENAV